MELRDYQTRLIDGTRAKLRAGVRRPLMVAPTGAGKTVMAGFMQSGAAQRGQRSWFTVHRREILERTAETFTELGIDFGMVLDGYPMRPDAPVQLCSVATLVGRLDQLPRPDGIVWDEAHHIVAGHHARIADAVAGAWQVGVTATPERLDGRGLAPFFDEMVTGPTTGELIERGFLSPYKYFAPGQPDLAGGREGMNRRDIASIMGENKLVGEAVDSWGELAFGKQTICFEMTRKASEATVAAFQTSGVEALHVDGDMHPDARREAFDAFKARQVQVLCNVAIAGEGVDIPGIEAAMLRYKTNSLTKFLQDLGRALRPVYADGHSREDEAHRLAAIAAGQKPWATLLDFGGNAFDFGMPCDDRVWSLLGAKERRKLQAENDRLPIRQCPQCFRVSPATVKVCPGCSFEHSSVYVPPAAAAGELFELSRLGKQQRKIEEEAARELVRKREKDEERNAPMATLMRLARERNAVTPGRYKDPKKWAAMKVGLREKYKGGRARFAGAR